MNNFLTYDLAHDAGNGYMKDCINDKRTIFPSIVANVSDNTNRLTLNDFNTPKRILDNYLDNMDISILSDGLINKTNNSNDNGIRYLVGKAATTGGVIPQTFNVTSSATKYSSDISLIAALSLVAYTAVADYYDMYNELPVDLQATVQRFATDLPIDEYRNDHYYNTYLSRFTDYTHVVTINSFEKPITVSINFEKASLQPEGITAERGLIFSPKTPRAFRNDDIFLPLIQSNNNLDYFDGQDLYQSGAVIIVDIGEGTIDFALIKGVTPLMNGNVSLNNGIGVAVQNAIEAYHQDNPQVRKPTRQTFTQKAELDNAKGRDYRSYLEKELPPINAEIIQQIKTVYTSTDEEVSYIILCGGGASTLKNTLDDDLRLNLKDIDRYGETKIFWVDPKYSQTLNLDGLQSRVISM